MIEKTTPRRTNVRAPAIRSILFADETDHARFIGAGLPPEKPKEEEKTKKKRSVRVPPPPIREGRNIAETDHADLLGIEPDDPSPTKKPTPNKEND